MLHCTNPENKFKENFQVVIFCNCCIYDLTVYFFICLSNVYHININGTLHYM